MPLSAALKAQVYLSALGKVRAGIPSTSAGQPTLTEGQLARWLRDKYDQNRRQAFASFQNIARAAIRGNRMAHEVDDAPTRTVPRNELPVDPSIRQDEPMLRYRVVVRAESVSRDVSSEIAFDIDSDRILTAAEIREMARQLWLRTYRYDPSGRGELRTNERVALDVFIISAGRRSLT